MKTFLFIILCCSTQLIFAQSHDPKPTGKLVNIGNYNLHIDAKGKGSPAVIFIAGSRAFSFDFTLVSSEISKITEAVTYDRPALAWSDPGPMPRSFEQDVYELHTLLEEAGVRPPYILVGHSLGGIIARKLEKKYPNEVKGLVLVDATSENTTLFINNKIQRLRLLSENKEIPPVKTQVDTFTKVPSQQEMDDFLKMIGEQKIEPPFDKLPVKFQEIRLWAMKQPKFLMADNGAYWAEEFAAMYNDSSYSMGNKPVFVITSGMNNYPQELGDSTTNELIKQNLQTRINLQRYLQTPNISSQLKALTKFI